MLCLAARWVLQGRVRENHHSLSQLLKSLRGRRASFLSRCFSLWAVFEAKNLRDPYAVVDACKAAFRFDPSRRLAGEMYVWVLESALWVGDKGLLADLQKTVESGHFELPASYGTRWGDFLAWKHSEHSNQTITAERLHSLAKDWRIAWIGFFIEGVANEMEGDFAVAVDQFRLALHGVPPWLPEARMIHERTQDLRALSRDADERSRPGGRTRSSCG
jgi:hypothetical protein